MRKLEANKLQQHIGLVKWQNRQPADQFSLVTVRSLIVDDNPKFQELKAIIRQFNNHNQKSIQRPNLRSAYIAKLYKMLCELVRIPKMENQLAFLDKVYQWASNGKDNGNENINGLENGKNFIRPTTASTRSRPFSSYSRPISNHAQQRLKVNEFDSIELDKNNKSIDYQKLKLGEKQFYQGLRTLHPQLQHPKKRLKQFHRKVFYDQNEQLQEQFIEEQPIKQKPVSEIKKYIQKKQQIKVQESVNPPNLQQTDVKPQEQKIEQQQLGQELVNVDDIPLDVENEGEAEIEEQQIVDKLKPAIKKYTDKQHQNIYTKQYYDGIYRYQIQRKNDPKYNLEQRNMQEYIARYNKFRSFNKSQSKRRSQSKRIATIKLGLPTYVEQQVQIKANLIQDFTKERVYEAKVGAGRLRTAFNSQNDKNLKEKINQAINMGKIKTHVSKQMFPQGNNQRFKSLTTYAHKGDNKKTFQQILYQAQQKVHKQAVHQAQKIKQALAKNKVSSSLQLISNTIGHPQIYLPGDDVLFKQISGLGMIKNPFFKVGKKKKKKK